MTSETSSPLGPVRAARRERMLDVAEHLFVSHGYRAVTMEGLARAAGVSKATIYAYFPDKDAAFRGVARRLARRMEGAVRQALGGAGSPAARIGDALVAKHALVFEVVRPSPFAAELFAARDKVVATLFDELDRGIEEMLAETMVDAGAARSSAAATARMLFGAANGISGHSPDLPTATFDIRALVGAVVGG